MIHDSEIIERFFARDESALDVLQQKYGGCLRRLAQNILGDNGDGEECVNSTYLKAWMAIPPDRPDNLAAYLIKITRRLAIDVLRGQSRQKRCASEYAVSMDELDDCLSAGDTTSGSVDSRALAAAINAYLRGISPEARCLFAGRYYYADSLKTLAGYYGMSEAKVKSSLYRTRQGLKNYLRQEGFEV